MITPALEIVDDRRADYDHISKEVHTLIADNAWNKGLVHGTLVRDWRQLDLASLQGLGRRDRGLLGLAPLERAGVDLAEGALACVGSKQ